MGEGFRRDRAVVGPHLVGILAQVNEGGGRSRARKTKTVESEKKKGGQVWASG